MTNRSFVVLSVSQRRERIAVLIAVGVAAEFLRDSIPSPQTRHRRGNKIAKILSSGLSLVAKCSTWDMMRTLVLVTDEKGNQHCPLPFRLKEMED